MTTAWRRQERVVKRIGVLQLWKHVLEERWAVTLDNRTYHNFYEIPPDRVERWLEEFDTMKGRKRDG